MTPAEQLVADLAATPGITFEEAVAKLVALGVPEREARTGLQGILVSIARPSEEARAALEACAVDVRRDTDAANRYHAYLRGFRDGASGHCTRREFGGHPTLGDVYREGRTAGQNALGVALDVASERLGYRPSILRGGA